MKTLLRYFFFLLCEEVSASHVEKTGSIVREGEAHIVSSMMDSGA